MMEPIINPDNSQISRETQIQQILDEHRSLANEALDDFLYEAFLEVGALLTKTGDSDGPIRAAGGLSSHALQRIREHVAAGDLADWLSVGADGDKSLYIRDFLNLGRLQAEELRARYPRAYSKWTDAEDEALLSSYQQVAQPGQRIPWSRMAEQLGRNPNALKIRLGHLGVDLGPETAHPRWTGGFTR
jgi:hypothetical protein